MPNTFFKTPKPSGFVDLLADNYKPVQHATGDKEEPFIDLLSNDYKSASPEPSTSDFSVMDTIKNIPESGVNFVKDTAVGAYNLLTNPKGVGEAVGGLARSYYNKAHQTYGFKKLVEDSDTSDTHLADAMNAKLDASYGTMGRAAKTIQNDPVGQVANLAGIMSGAGMITGAKGLGKVGAAIDPVNMIAKGIQKGASVITPKAGGANLVRGLVKKDLAKSGLTIEEASKRMDEMGEGSTLADVSPLTRHRAEVTANNSTEGLAAAQPFFDRAKTTSQRVGDTIDDLFAGKRITLDKMTDDIIKDTKAAAEPLYKEAYNKQIEVTPELYKMMDTPDIKNAYKAAKRIAANDGVKLPDELIESIPTMETWDYIKKGLDQTIESQGTTPLGKTTPLGRNINGLKHRLLEQIDSQNPSYKEARKVYAGGVATKKAGELGKDFLKPSMTDREIKRVLSDMSKSEKDAYRLGAMQRLYDEAKKVTDEGSAYKRLMGNSAKRDKIEAVIQDDAAFKKLEHRLETEADFNETQTATLRGSQTARRMLGDENQGASLAEGFIDGGVMGSVRRGLVHGGKKLYNKTGKQHEELATILMSPNIDLNKALKKTQAKPSAIVGGQSVYQSSKQKQDVEELLRIKRAKMKKLAQGML